MENKIKIIFEKFFTTTVMRSAFWIFVLSYAALFLIHASFGPTDDFVFVRTILSGVPINYYTDSFPYYDTIRIGRFTPLAAHEYNLALLISDSPAALWFYLIHAVQFVALAYFFTGLLGRVTPSKRLAYLCFVLLVLTPGFTFSWFRLQMNERNVVLYLAVFLYFYLGYLTSRRTAYLFISWLAATLAVYYKETAFLAVGTFAFVHLISIWRTADLRRNIYLIMLLASALSYVAVYALLVLPHGGVWVYGKPDQGAVLVGVKNFLNYLFVSDPIILLAVFPLALWRLNRIVYRKNVFEPLYDSLLAAAVVFVSAYFVLNLSGMYYFQPAYVLALPPLIYYFKEFVKVRMVRVLFAVAMLLTAANTLPTGLHYLTFYKLMPSNFNSTLDVLAQDMRTRHPHHRPSIYLDGLNRGTGKFMYFIYSEFLRQRGLAERDYDLKSDLESDVLVEAPFPFLEMVETPYTVFQRGPLPSISSGDYLILTPQSTDSRRNIENLEYLASLEKDYMLLFRTDSFFSFPMFNLKSLGRYLISIGAEPGDKFVTISRHKPLFEQPDYAIYVRK